MLQPMDGCWHRLSSLDLHFKPVRRQPYTVNLQLLGCQVFQGIFPFLKISLNLSANTSPTFSSLPCPAGITFPPCLHLQAAWLTAAPAAGTASSPHLAVPAGAAALGHALDLPGQGLVHQVRQGLLTEQVGPQLHTGRVFQAGKTTGEEQKELLSHSHHQRSQTSPPPLIMGLQQPTGNTDPTELPALLPRAV